MTLNKSRIKTLRTLAHSRKPFIWIGRNGVTDNVQSEIETALDIHELIKVRFRAGNRALRNAMIADLCARTGAAPVQRIGNCVALYRVNKLKPKILFTDNQ